MSSGWLFLAACAPAEPRGDFRSSRPSLYRTDFIIKSPDASRHSNRFTSDTIQPSLRAMMALGRPIDTRIQETASRRFRRSVAAPTGLSQLGTAYTSVAERRTPILLITGIDGAGKDTPVTLLARTLPVRSQ